MEAPRERLSVEWSDELEVWLQRLPLGIDRIWRFRPDVEPFAEPGYGQRGNWAYFDYHRDGWKRHAEQPPTQSIRQFRLSLVSIRSGM